MIDLTQGVDGGVKVIVKPLLGAVFFDELIEAVDNARLWVMVAQYQWKWNVHQRHSAVQRLGEAIYRARKRNVEVSVVLNQESPKHHLTRINTITANRLAEMGCQIKMMPPSVLLHSKVWVIDGRVSFIGSHNISTRALKVNEEVSVKIVGSEVAHILKEYIERLKQV